MERIVYVDEVKYCMFTDEPCLDRSLGIGCRGCPVRAKHNAAKRRAK